jgi:hypothetical protein
MSELQMDTATPKHVMAILDGTGDTRVTWDHHNADETAAAKSQFDTLRKKGFLAYTVDKKGEKREMITEFDPHAEKIILSPPLAGG